MNEESASGDGRSREEKLREIEDKDRSRSRGLPDGVPRIILYPRQHSNKPISNRRVRRKFERDEMKKNRKNNTGPF
jgi:hypothetical protein